MGLGQIEVLPSEHGPHSPLALVRFFQVPYRDLRSEQGPTASIKGDELSRYVIPRDFAISVEQHRSNPGRAEPFTVKGEKRQFIGRVEYPEIPLELQAVDNNWFGFQANVFGAKVPVTLNNPSRPHTLVEKFGVALQEIQLLGRDPPRLAGW